jgi:hypothetical protein
MTLERLLGCPRINILLYINTCLLQLVMAKMMYKAKINKQINKGAKSLGALVKLLVMAKAHTHILKMHRC